MLHWKIVLVSYQSDNVSFPLPSWTMWSTLVFNTHVVIRRLKVPESFQSCGLALKICEAMEIASRSSLGG